jgi:hypothetical protein
MMNSSFSSSTSITDHQEVKSIYHAIMTFDLDKLQRILNNLEIRKSLEIVNLVDEAGHNVLHSAAYYNTAKIGEFLVSFFKKRLVNYLKEKHLMKKGLTSQDELDQESLEAIK